MTAPERKPPSKAFLTLLGGPLNPLAPLRSSGSLSLFLFLLEDGLAGFSLGGYSPSSSILPRTSALPSSSSTRSRPLDSSSPLRNCYPCLRLMLRYFFLLLLPACAAAAAATPHTPVKRRAVVCYCVAHFSLATLREKLTNLPATRLSLSLRTWSSVEWGAK